MVTSEAIESPSKRKDFLKVSSDLQRDSIGRSSLQNDRYEAFFEHGQSIVIETKILKKLNERKDHPMKKKLQVDRFEGDLAVLFDMDYRLYNVPKDIFGFELHAGDYLDVTFENDVPTSAVFLAEETEAARQRIKALMAKMRKKK